MRRAPAVAAAYLAVTVPFVSPLIDYAHLATASYEGDARLLIWTLAWDAHALMTGMPLFDANIFYPQPHALAQAEHHIGLGLFAAPIYAATGNPVLTYWVLWLLAFPLNGVAMHALAWRVTRDHCASLVAGVVYAFCFFRMHHAHGHLQLLWTWALPLVPLAVERWAGRPTWPHAGMLATLVTIQALSSWYLAVFAVLLLVVSLAVHAGPAFMIEDSPATALVRRHLLQAAVMSVACAGVVGWFARPYFQLASGPSAEAVSNAADLKAYFMPPEHTWLGQSLIRNTSLEPRWIWGEQTTPVGLTAALLALAGLWRLRRHRADRLTAAVVVTGLLALALSFGPSGAGVTPFDLFARLPGMSLLRAPARFALLVMQGVALLAALGLTTLVSRHRTPVLVRVAFTVMASAAVLAESYVVRFPGGKPVALSTPGVYRHIAERPAGPVLSLPTYRATPEAFREADYLLFSTSHWRPIVNGFGRQEPPAHGGRMAVLRRFPDREAIELMRVLRIRYVVLHTRRAGELAGAADTARTMDAVRLIHSADGDYAFEIRP